MAFIIDIPASENEFDYPYHAAFCKVVFSKINYKTNTILVNSECFGDNKSNWMNTTPVKTLTHTINLNLFECINEEVLETHIKETYYPDAVPGDADSIYGCMNPEAYNYNPEATVDDGTCVGTASDGTHYYTFNACECTPNYQVIEPLRMDDEGHDYFISSQGGEAGQFYCVGTNTDQTICGVIKDHGYAVEIPENYYPLEELIPYLETQGVSGPYFNADPQDGCEVCCEEQYPAADVTLTLNQQENPGDYIVNITSTDEEIDVATSFTFAFTTEIINLIAANAGELVGNEEEFEFIPTFGPQGTIVCVSLGGNFNIQPTPGQLLTFTIANGDSPPLLTPEQVQATVVEGDNEYVVDFVINPYIEPIEGLTFNVNLTDSYGDGGGSLSMSKVNVNYVIAQNGNLVLAEPYEVPISLAYQPDDEENFPKLEKVGEPGVYIIAQEGMWDNISGALILPSADLTYPVLLCVSCIWDTWPTEGGLKITNPDGIEFCCQVGGTPVECPNEVNPQLCSGWSHWYMEIDESGATQRVWADLNMCNDEEVLGGELVWSAESEE